MKSGSQSQVIFEFVIPTVTGLRVPKSPSPDGCSTVAVAAPAPLSLGQVLVGFIHHSPPPCLSPGQSQAKLCSPWSCREVLPESLTVLLTSVLCSAVIYPCGKAAAMMGGEPG